MFFIMLYFFFLVVPCVLTFLHSSLYISGFILYLSLVTCVQVIPETIIEPIPSLSMLVKVGIYAMCVLPV